MPGKGEPDPEKLMNYLIGQAIKACKADPKLSGKHVDPVMIRRLLEEFLEEAARKRNQKTDVEPPLGRAV